MGQIYISAETKKKLQKAAASEKNKLLLEKFDPNRKKQKTIDSTPTIKKEDAKKTQARTVRKISEEEWAKIKANANRQGYEVEIKRRLEEKRKINRLVDKYGVASDKAKKKKHRKASLPGTPKPIVIGGKKNPLRLRDDYSKPLHDTTGKDYYDFAGEYASRGVEFGHGRKKSLEWQGVHLSGTGGSVKRMKKLMRDDPNTFDRQATK